MMFQTASRHKTERLRQEPKRRLLTVATVTQLTPHMLRVTFASPDLADFSSPSPDDHIKLFLPDPANPAQQVMRDYTPRAFDAAKKILTIDFAVHDAGPATAWALAAKPGDRLAIGGPKGSTVTPDDFDFYLLIGDEAALPAIGRRVEGLRPGVPVVTIMVVDGPEDVQTFETRADWTPVWVYRQGEHVGDAALLCHALDAWKAPEGEGYVWIAAEARVAKSLRDVMLDDRGHPKNWLKASGYWVYGQAGAMEKLDN